MLDFDARTHNEEVAKLRADFDASRNRRVPVTFGTDEAVWLKLAGRTFREFYTDPEVQLRVQLEGQAWFSDNIVGDQPAGPPKEHWGAGPRFWMDVSEYFGCETVIQDDDFAWSKPLDMPKPDILAHLRGVDAAQRVKASRLWRLYEAMSELADGMTFRGLPVRVGFPGGGCHGIFTETCRVRGIQQMCVDMVEDPDFARELLETVTEALIARFLAWNSLSKKPEQYPRAGGWGMADDSLQLISPAMYERFVLPCHERIYSAMTIGRRTMHLCGRAEQHYRALHGRLGIRAIDGPGPFVDHGKWLTELPDLRLDAQTNHTVLMLGPVAAIDRMMRSMLTDTAKRPGRFQIMGFLLRDTPLSHVRAMYEAGRRYGVIQGEA
jgi:hypothetical protein